MIAADKPFVFGFNGKSHRLCWLVYLLFMTNPNSMLGIRFKTGLLLMFIATFQHYVLAQLPNSQTTSAAKTDDAWKNQFKPSTGVAQQATPETTSSKVTYTLQRAKEPNEDERAAYEKVTAAMDKAVQYYNEYTQGIHEHVTVIYSPGTPTADANLNGPIRFGSTSHNQRVAMHELAHTLGVGTSPQWAKLVDKGVFTGKHATEQLRKITGDQNSVLHADRQHFWPYGLNYDNEVHSDADFVNHCKMVTAICKDLKAVH